MPQIAMYHIAIIIQGIKYRCTSFVLTGNEPALVVMPGCE